MGEEGEDEAGEDSFQLFEWEEGEEGTGFIGQGVWERGGGYEKVDV